MDHSRTCKESENSLSLSTQQIHKIRNELNTILGYSELLQDQNLYFEQQSKMLQSISLSASNIQSLLINKDISKIHSQHKQQYKKSILIVDDNEDNCTILELITKKYEVDVFTAKNGLDAIAIAKDKRPQLVFMDINLPDISGFVVAELIKDVLKDAVIIALSGDFKVLEQEQNALFSLCILKPFERKQIQDILSKYCSIQFKQPTSSQEISQEYLQTLKECAQIGRINCLENLVQNCKNDSVKEFLSQKLLAFEFDEIVTWVHKYQDPTDESIKT